MKLKALLKALNKLPKKYLDSEIILQKDSEGNGYSPLAGIDENCIYVPYNSWSGAVSSTKDSAEDLCFTDEEYGELLKKPRSIVLFPVN